MTKSKKDVQAEVGDERSQAEADRISKDTLKRLLDTPPKPFTPKAKKPKGSTSG